MWVYYNFIFFIFSGEEKPIPKLPTIPVKLLKRRKQKNKDVIKAQLKRSAAIRQRAKERRSVVRRPAHFIAVIHFFPSYF